MDTGFKSLASYSFFHPVQDSSEQRVFKRRQQSAAIENQQAHGVFEGACSGWIEREGEQVHPAVAEPLRCERMKRIVNQRGFALAQAVYGAAQYGYEPMKGIAKQLALHAAWAAPLVTAYRASASQGCRMFNLNLSGLGRAQADFLRDLFQSLAQAGFFQKHEVHRDRLCFCAVQNAFLAGFMTGVYLEAWAYRQVQNILNTLLRKSRVPFEVLSNAHLMHGGQTIHELDVLILIENQMFIIEAKSGDFTRSDFSPMLDAAKRLGIPNSHCLVVCSGRRNAEARNRLTQSTGVHVCSAEDFAPTLRRMIGR